MQREDSTRGFTLVELCCAIVIAGILAALAGPKLLDTAAFVQRGYSDELAAAIRSAEAVAIASGCEVSVSIDPAGYSASQRRGVPAAGGRTCATSGVFTKPVVTAEGTPLAGNSPTNAAASGSVNFVLGSDGSIVGPAPVANPTVVTVGARTVEIDPSSGFVTVL